MPCALRSLLLWRETEKRKKNQGDLSRLVRRPKNRPVPITSYLAAWKYFFKNTHLNDSNARSKSFTRLKSCFDLHFGCFVYDARFCFYTLNSKGWIKVGMLVHYTWMFANTLLWKSLIILLPRCFNLMDLWSVDSFHLAEILVTLKWLGRELWESFLKRKKKRKKSFFFL